MKTALTLTLAATCALNLVACGGEMAPDEPVLLGSARITSPLLDDEGRMMPTGLRPADGAALTRSTGYASAAQARQLAETLGDGVLIVDVAAGGAESVERAVQAAQDHVAVRWLEHDVPMFVRGGDLRLAATAAQRLADAGFTRVWLVLK